MIVVVVVFALTFAEVPGMYQTSDSLATPLTYPSPANRSVSGLLVELVTTYLLPNTRCELVLASQRILARDHI